MTEAHAVKADPKTEFERLSAVYDEKARAYEQARREAMREYRRQRDQIRAATTVRRSVDRLAAMRRWEEAKLTHKKDLREAQERLRAEKRLYDAATRQADAEDAAVARAVLAKAAGPREQAHQSVAQLKAEVDAAWKAQNEAWKRLLEAQRNG